MDQVNQGSNNEAPPNLPVKRKRGRPRKDHSLSHGKSVKVPPGFGGVNGNQFHDVDATENANDSIVGQAVTGVVEAAFDAGYLLTVKIGNSNVSLRGVVFKPGHFVPISAENDVAPHVQMISRNEVSFPVQNQSRVRGRRPRSRERNEQRGNLSGSGTGHLLNESDPTSQLHNLAPATDQVSAEGKDTLPAAAYTVPSVGSRGTVVPVVLPIANQVNKVPADLSLAADTVASKKKQVKTVSNQVPLFQPQTSHLVTPEDLQNDNGPFQQGPEEVLHGEVVVSMKPTGVSTPNEVDGVHFSSQSPQAQIENSEAADKREKGSGLSLQRESVDKNEALFVEPLQSVPTDTPNPSGRIDKPPEHNNIGRMCELLQALQDNMIEPDT
ncbi:protein METABOLIC NETWORK MODULATOR 1 [Diospyros lotus]|uniref:protein METABOLIC NETWORK MODULATOR 1 n=1 Tax=Diospyros lotus TaxID=55363 RepID=UPI00225247FE|nr:protein METABOLIC NETWORK MODULATOR 1 [Diospyros lotus]